MNTDEKIRYVLECVLSDLVIVEDGWYRRPKTEEMMLDQMADVAFRMKWPNIWDAEKTVAERYPDVPFQTLEELKGPFANCGWTAPSKPSFFFRFKKVLGLQ